MRTNKRLAQLIAGEKTPNQLVFNSALPSHGLLTPFRRLGQRMAYHWYYLNDEII